MLLTFEQMAFLADVLEKDKDGKHRAKQELTDDQQEYLLELDEMNFTLYGEHLITNYNELKGAK